MSDDRNRENVFVGAPDVSASGGLTVGPVISDPKKYPTDASTPIPAELGQKPVGFISQDGITKTVDRTTEKIKDWNGDTIITLETEHSCIVKLTLIEAANAHSLEAVYGKDNVKIEGNKFAITDSAGELPHKSWVAELNGGENKKGRIFIPDGQITNVGDIVYVKSDVIKYEVEIECYADKNSKKFYQFMELPKADTGSAS